MAKPMLPRRTAHDFLESLGEGTPATNAAVRTVFVIGPDKRIKLQLSYPMTTGRKH
jgi:alkyl hydroperoxide reductase subunit AhpC